MYRFSISSDITIESRPVSMGGEMTKVQLRWPTDAEWVTRQKSRKFILRRFGRGRSETVPPDPGEHDRTLFDAICLNGAPSFTPAEAAKILELLGQADVTDVVIEGTTARVKLDVLGGTTEHTMGIPSADQAVRFRRAAYKMVDLPYNQQELRLSPEAGARLYDECGGKSENYDGPIPAIHKDTVAKNVLDHLDRELGPQRDDANF